MDELSLLIKLSLTKVQVEIMMVTAAVIVVAAIVTVVVTMEVVDVDLVVGGIASSVASQDILQGSVLVVKFQEEVVAGMVVGMISTVEEEEEVVVVAAMETEMEEEEGLIEMETDTVGAAGILVLVVVQALEAIVSVVTALVHMSVGGQEVSALDRISTLDSAHDGRCCSTVFHRLHCIEVSSGYVLMMSEWTNFVRPVF